MKKVCIVAIPRTGTNYLCSLLNQHPDIDSRLEIFHNKKPYSINNNEIDAFIRELNIKRKTDSIEEVVKIIGENPMKLTNYLLKNSKKNILSYKIFPWQLNFNMLKKDIICDKDTVFLFCKRKTIDSYISKEKALITSEYNNVNTTNIKININFEDYKIWYVRMQRWYKYMEETIKNNNQKITTILYEDFIKCNDDINLKYILNYLEKLDIELKEIDSNVSSCQKKQDNNNDYTKKVLNWNDFFHDAIKENWEDRIESYFI